MSKDKAAQSAPEREERHTVKALVVESFGDFKKGETVEIDYAAYRAERRGRKRLARKPAPGYARVRLKPGMLYGRFHAGETFTVPEQEARLELETIRAKPPRFEVVKEHGVEMWGDPLPVDAAA